MITPGVPILISVSELLEKVSEIEIALKYVNGFRKVGKAFRSEFRPDRRANSCFIFEDRVTGHLKYKDFADTDLKTQINLFEYIARKYNISLDEAVNKVAFDFNIVREKPVFYENPSIRIDEFNLSKTSEEEKSSSELTIKIKSRDWTKFDIEYWNQYSIPVDLLERNNIKSISHIWLYRDNKKIFSTEFLETHPVFSYEYYWSNGIFRRKIYRPFSKDYKWMTNTDYTVVQNYPNIPKTGDLLFIQSSYKDCMVMELMGYHAIAPNNEGSWLPIKYWNKIKERWKRIIIFGNNDWDKEDNPGFQYAKRHSERFGIPFIMIPGAGFSDISDYVKVFGLEQGKDLTERLIREI